MNLLDHPACIAISNTIKKFAELGYNHDGQGSLPIRPDVRTWLNNVMCSTLYGRRSYGLLQEPGLTLEFSGIVQLMFFEGDASLYLTFPCYGTVLYEMHLPDNATVVHGRIDIDADFKFDHAELDNALHWIERHSSRIERKVKP